MVGRVHAVPNGTLLSNPSDSFTIQFTHPYMPYITQSTTFPAFQISGHGVSMASCLQVVPFQVIVLIFTRPNPNLLLRLSEFVLWPDLDHGPPLSPIYRPLLSSPSGQNIATHSHCYQIGKIIMRMPRMAMAGLLNHF